MIHFNETLLYLHFQRQMGIANSDDSSEDGIPWTPNGIFFGQAGRHGDGDEDDDDVMDSDDEDSEGEGEGEGEGGGRRSLRRCTQQ